MNKSICFFFNHASYHTLFIANLDFLFLPKSFCITYVFQKRHAHVKYLSHSGKSNKHTYIYNYIYIILLLFHPLLTTQIKKLNYQQK